MQTFLPFPRTLGQSFGLEEGQKAFLYSPRFRASWQACHNVSDSWAPGWVTAVPGPSVFRYQDLALNFSSRKEPLLFYCLDAREVDEPWSSRA